MKIKSVFWKIILVFLVLITGVIGTNADPSNDYNNGVIPTPPYPFPGRFKDYQILPASISPDKQYAIIYPKRTVLYDLKEYSLYLVSLNPFRVLTAISGAGSNLATNAHGYYGINWSKDSSAVVMIEGRKWGAGKVFLTTIHDGNVGSITDLTEMVAFQVDPDFTESKASRFNDYNDFLFMGYTEGWDFINDHQIQINAVCTTDPKDLEKNAWTVRFQGIWDISKGDFISKKITRLKEAP